MTRRPRFPRFRQFQRAPRVGNVNPKQRNFAVDRGRLLVQRTERVHRGIDALGGRGLDIGDSYFMNDFVTPRHRIG
jgi:hypothetical protein